MTIRERVAFTQQPNADRGSSVTIAMYLSALAAAPLRHDQQVSKATPSRVAVRHTTRLGRDR